MLPVTSYAHAILAVNLEVPNLNSFSLLYMESILADRSFGVCR